MRSVLITIVSLAVAAAPANASSVTPNAPGAGCVASLERGKAGAGFDVVRSCTKSSARSAGALAIARQPVKNGSSLQDGDDNEGVGSAGIVVGLLAAVALVFGIVSASSSPDRPVSP